MSNYIIALGKYKADIVNMVMEHGASHIKSVDFPVFELDNEVSAVLLSQALYTEFGETGIRIIKVYGELKDITEQLKNA